MLQTNHIQTIQHVAAANRPSFAVALLALLLLVAMAAAAGSCAERSTHWALGGAVASPSGPALSDR